MATLPFMPPTLGALRTRLVIEAPVDSTDASGGATRTYAAMGSAWGRVVPLRGTDDVIGDRPGQVLSHRVTMRWRAGVDASMALRIGHRRLAIRAVYDPDERRRALVCLCQELRP